MTAHTETSILPRHQFNGNEQLIDKKQINQNYSFYVISKANAYYNSLVFQRVEMYDGTVYLLKSNSQGTKDILPERCREYNVTQKEVREWFTPYTFWY